PLHSTPSSQPLPIPLSPIPPPLPRFRNTRVCATPVDGFSGEADYDRFLGELIFSQSDVRDDVLKSLDKAGDEG
ncbi:unnamed protein product, partial [Laminaria digitata]